MLRRKGVVLHSHNCVFCTQDTEETLQHLFLNCPLSLNFRQTFCQSIGLHVPALLRSIDVIMSFRRQLSTPFFIEIIILGCWSIWMTRNDFIFKNLQPSLKACQLTFKKEFALAQLRVKSSLVDLMKEWINNIL